MVFWAFLGAVFFSPCFINFAFFLFPCLGLVPLHLPHYTAHTTAHTHHSTHTTPRCTPPPRLNPSLLFFFLPFLGSVLFLVLTLSLSSIHLFFPTSSNSPFFFSLFLYPLPFSPSTTLSPPTLPLPLHLLILFYFFGCNLHLFTLFLSSVCYYYFKNSP